MLQMIKKMVKHSALYQMYKVQRFMPVSFERFGHLDDDEKTPIRVCVNRGKKINQISRMCEMIKIQLHPQKRYQVWLDTGLVVPAFDSMTDNIPPNYALIVDNSIEDLKKRFTDNSNIVNNNNIQLLNSVEKYINRIVSEMRNVGDNCFNTTIDYFNRMLTTPAESLEEAFQRILFWSSLFWQSNHRLVGLGRLDKILDRFDDSDIDIAIITDFYREIHRYYPFKSNSVTIGDTGQIIILGGIEADGSYFSNNLTYMFIDAMEEVQLPDPKILLRVSEKMPLDLLCSGVKCVSTGLGCPLFSNDDIVIPALEDFGYTHSDSCNYVTSACWEPIAYGKSLEKNNINDLNYANAIVGMYSDEGFESCETFDEIMILYKKYLLDEIDNIRRYLDSVKWEPDPLLSLFTEGCIENRRDISSGGATYNDYGILGVGISNAVDSLLNIKQMAFDCRSVTLSELKKAVVANFIGYNNLRELLEQNKYYGKDDDNILKMTKSIAEYVYENLSNYRNCFGGKVKWGLSSSNYLESGKKTKATLDGRRCGENLGVHISCQDAIPFTELISFASRMNYMGNRSNGNVVDFFISPGLIQNNFDKFVDFIKQSIKLGFFQMQMNVVDSKTLIEAKNHPDKYPNLIVRVWGFSAYFNDLPESYKEVLIKRALHGESVAY